MSGDTEIEELRLAEQRARRLGLEPSSCLTNIEGSPHRCWHAPTEIEVQHSAAKSLKRIADALEGNLSAGGFANLEQLAWSMGQAFERGRAAA